MSHVSPFYYMFLSTHLFLSILLLVCTLLSWACIEPDEGFILNSKGYSLTLPLSLSTLCVASEVNHI